MPGLGRKKLREQSPLPCLELLLCAWEDFWFLVSLLNRASAGMETQPLCSETGAALNASRFRDFLLGIHRDGGTEGLNDFKEPADMPAEQRFLPAFAQSIFAWMLLSRRIFRANQDLQALLKATSLEAVRWSDVNLPFDSFAIELDPPFRDPEGDLFDFVLLEKLMHKNIGLMHLRFFSTQRNKYEPLTIRQRERLQSLINQRRFDLAQEECTALLLKTDRCTSSHVFFEIPEDGEAVVDTANRLYTTCYPHQDNPGAFETWNAMIRTMVGMALYLKTLPPGSPHCSPPSKPFRSGLPDRKVISNRWEVCDVTSVIPLTREERVFLGMAGTAEEQRLAKYELSCHFREGHWRRPPGKGDDPTAERSVHVRPCLVRRDRLPDEGGLPSGALKGD